MSNRPTSRQLQRFQEALLDAFDHDSLTQLTRIYLDINLQRIASVTGNLTTIVDNLVAYFASQDGGLKELFRAAVEANPANASLMSLGNEWQELEFATIPLPDEHPLQTIIEGDNVIGDKVAGDKIVYQQAKPYRPPLQRPPRSEYFQDRKDELAKLLNELKPGKVATICGPGGMGKSALAAEAVWTLAPDNATPERFPDGIFFHSFYNQPQAVVALEQIALSFGEDTRGSPQAAAQRALSQRIALLVLDGTEEADDLPAVLAVRNHCGVIVTSRKRADAVADRQDLPPLPSSDAVNLLDQLSSLNGINATDTAIYERLVELVGCLPLAVRLVGRYLVESAMDASDYCEWLDASPLSALEQGQRRDRSIPILLRRSVSQISEQAQAALAVMGCLALAPFPADAVAAALELGNRWKALNILGELVAFGMLIQREKDYELSHSLIHTYVREQLSNFEDVGTHLVDWLLRTIKQREGDVDALANLLPHLIALQKLCTEASRWQEVEDLANAIDSYLDLQGLWAVRANVIQLALNAIDSSDARQNKDILLGRLGLTYRRLGQLEKTIDIYQQALSIAKENRDRVSEGAHMGDLASAYREVGRVQEAIDLHKQALSIARETGERTQESRQLGSMGLAYRALGREEEAINLYQQALAIAREVGDRRLEGIQLGGLGGGYYLLGRLDEAIDYFQQGLAVAKETNDKGKEGGYLGNLGNAYADLGQIEEAVAYYQKTLALAKATGNRQQEGLVLGNIAVIYEELGQANDAIGYYQNALSIAREVGARPNEGLQLENLASVYTNVGRVEEAIDHYQRCLVIYEEINSPFAEDVRQALSKLTK